MQGDKVDPRQVVGSLASFLGGDEMARRGLIAQGQTPGKDFAITSDRADAIANRDADAKQQTAWGTARINHASDVPVAQVRAGATLGAARIGADSRVTVAGMKAAGPAPGFDAITAALPGARMNSGLRSPEHNRKVGGVANSTHLGQTPGVQGYDIPVQPGMTVEQAAAKIEAASGGRVKVVEMRDETGRVGPNGKKLGGWHFALMNVGGGSAWGKAKAPAEKPPKAFNAATMKMLEQKVSKFEAANVGANGPIGINASSKNLLLDEAIRRYRKSGNPVSAVAEAADAIGLTWEGKPKKAAAAQPAGMTPSAFARKAADMAASVVPKPPVAGARMAPDGKWYVQTGKHANGSPAYSSVSNW